MLLVLNIFSIQLCWLASLLTYSASKQQMLWKQPVDKKLAWAGFALLTLTASVMQSQLYHWLAAGIIVLVVVMTCWIMLALCVPHLPKAKPIYWGGSLFMLATSLLGGFHVV